MKRQLSSIGRRINHVSNPARRILVLLAFSFAACQAPQPVAVYGKWVVTEHVAPGRSSMSSSEADRFRGTSLTYSADQAVLLDRSCAHPRYERWKLSPRHFEADYGVAPSRLGITGDSVDVVRIDCTIGGQAAGSELVVVSADRLIYPTGGVFFLLSRVAT